MKKKKSIATYSVDRMIMHIAQRRLAFPSRGLHLATSSQHGSRQRRRSASYRRTRAHVDQHNLLDYVTRVMLANNIVSTKAHFHIVNYQLLYIYLQKRSNALSQYVKYFATYIKKKIIYWSSNKVLTREPSNIINHLLSEQRSSAL